MRTLIHLSDLHFGQTEPGMAPVLADTASKLRPDIVVISGDLTMRARQQEFAEAKEFLDLLPGPKIVVPGNHDIPPWYQAWPRWHAPLEGFRTHISDDLVPFYADS